MPKWSMCIDRIGEVVNFQGQFVYHFAFFHFRVYSEGLANILRFLPSS